MTNNYLVSIIIPVYNVEQYIPEALDSIIQQTYTNLEIILIDDGSTDGSGEICDRYGVRDRRIKVYHQENRGLSAARNAGLDIASGKIIGFLDPDDAFHPDMISKMLERLEVYQADISICGFSIHETQGLMKPEITDKPIWQLCNRNEIFHKLLNDEIDTAPWNRLYKRSIWKDLRFPAGRVYEGAYTSFDIFDRADRIAITNEKLVMYRIRPGSISNTTSLKHTLDSFFSVDHYLSFVRKNTPEIFSEVELQKTVQKKVKGRIVAFLICYQKKSVLKDNRSYIRKELISVKDDLDNCGFLTRICYYSALLFPHFCAMLYSLYRLIRHH